MNEATLKKNIADIIQLMFTRIVEVGGIETTIVDVPVIFADNINVYVGAPRPPYPFITIRILSIAQVGESEFSTIDDDGVMGIGAQKIATITVEYFGTNPNQNLAKIVIGLEKKTILGHLISASLSFIRTTQIQNLTGLGYNGSVEEERASFDLQLGFVDEYSDTVGLIEHVEVEKTIEAGGFTVTGTEVFDIV